MSTSGQEGAAKKTRKRVQHSCDYCLKCDSATMPGNRCTNCAQIGAECTHALPTKKRGPKNPYVQELEERIRIMTEKLQSKDLLTGYRLTIEQDQDQQEISPVSSSSSTSTSTSSNLLSAAGVLPSISSLNDTAILLGDNAIDSGPPLDLSSDFVQDRFFGASSGYTLMKKVYDVKTEVLSDHKIPPRALFQRLEYWFMRPWERASRNQQMPRYNFPEADLMLSLVSLYLVNVNIFFPIVHAPTFKRLIVEGLHLRDQHFGAVVLLVCAVGSKYTADPRVLHTPEFELSSGHQWFVQVQMARQSLFEMPSLYELQCFCLAILYLIGSPEPKSTWILVAMGIRFCCELGLHRRKPEGHIWTLEEEQKKRAFWVLVTLDKLTASFLGRPSAIHDEDVDADLPLQRDDEEWADQNPNSAYEQLSDKPSIIAAFNSYLRLCDILDFALRTLYSTKKSQLLLGLVGQDWREKIVYDLDSSLNEWISSLPEYLRSESGKNGEGIFAMQSAFLYTAYYHLQIYIHRPFLPKPSPRALPSLSICTAAAKSCARVLDCQRNGSVASLPHTQYAAFAAGVVLLFDLWANKRAGIKIDDQHKEMQSVEILLRVLQEQEAKSASAGRFWDMLTELKRGYDHPPPGRTNLGLNLQDHTAWKKTSRSVTTKLTENKTTTSKRSEHSEPTPPQPGISEIDVWSTAPPGFSYNEWVYYIEDMSGMGGTW